MSWLNKAPSISRNVLEDSVFNLQRPCGAPHSGHRLSDHMVYLELLMGLDTSMQEQGVTAFQKAY